MNVLRKTRISLVVKAVLSQHLFMIAVVMMGDDDVNIDFISGNDKLLRYCILKIRTLYGWGMKCLGQTSLSTILRVK